MLENDYLDERLKTLLLETLSVFEHVNENLINLIVAIFHYLGEVDGGHIGISQGDPYSSKWEAIMSELVQKNLVAIEQKGYREYFFKGNCITNNYKKSLEELKKKSYNELREITLYLHFKTTENKQRTRHRADELNDLLNMQWVSTSAT